MGKDDMQVGGTHYTKLKIQPWDYIHANDLGYFEGSVIKYLSRWKEKNGIEDLRKAQHFLTRLIELTEETESKADYTRGVQDTYTGSADNSGVGFRPLQWEEIKLRNGPQ